LFDLGTPGEEVWTSRQGTLDGLLRRELISVLRSGSRTDGQSGDADRRDATQR
jgi:hypothetical protein